MTTDDDLPTPPTPNDAATPADVDAGRRAALRKLRTLAVWTTPTIVTLVVSRRATAASDDFGNPLGTPG